MTGDEIVKIVQILAVAIPATVAAISSLKNGGKIRELHKAVDGSDASPVKKLPKKNGKHPDWYSAPKLW